MILRGVKFEDVIQASGTTNFDGKGWWYHHLLRPFGLNFKGSTFTSKTATLMKKAGNMPLKSDGKTLENILPRCVLLDHKHLSVLNAVGLSNPGLAFLLRQKWWYVIDKPFFISIAPISTSSAGKTAEIEVMCEMLLKAKKDATHKFKAPWGIQINISCPNTSETALSSTEETALSILEGVSASLPEDVPVVIKLGPETDPLSTIRISKHQRCDCLCFSNTMPFGARPDWIKQSPHIPWNDLYGTDKPNESPLQKRFIGFAGGYSGKYLLPITCEWINAVRKIGVNIPIIGGGGILSTEDAGHVIDSGADAVSLGSIAMLRPTKVASTIKGVKKYLGLKRKRPNLNFREIEFNV
jgi:dihydroorotate dehydrogenase (NAD+) catalytic subunit